MTDFATFARDHGLILREVVADGRVHRTPTEMHPRKRNGAYAFDGERGFVQAWDVHSVAIPYHDKSRQQTPAPPARRQALRDDRKEAQKLAAAIVKRCDNIPHAYLTSKGFPHECGLVDPDDGRLIVPMWDATSDKPRLLSVQRITEGGEKKFLRGGTAKDAVYHLGRGGRDYLVEGFATGLSVRAACEMMYLPSRVVVCFSAHNLASVARLYPHGAVIADNDESRTGEECAIKTGLPWIMPPQVGEDANDFHRRMGLRALCDLIRSAGG